MAIEFRCSQCNQLLRVPEQAAGKNARCPKCQALMTVPGVAVALPLPSEPSPIAPTSSIPALPEPSPATLPKNPFAGEPFDGPAPTRPKPSGDNPFDGEPIAPADGLNPYASPAAAAYYAPQFFTGPRPGLPWEYQGHGLGAWWETAKLCMLRPTYAFSIMRQYGGMGSPMLYCGFGMAIGAFGNLLWQIPLILGIAFFGNQPGGGADVGILIGTQIGLQVAQSAIGVALGATLGLLIGTAIIHLCLMMVGGARYGFETTLRALAFAQGSTAWLNVVPCVGPLVILVWVIVLEIIGIAQAHETSIGKSALAVFLPLIICCGGAIALVIAFGVAGRLGAFR